MTLKTAKINSLEMPNFLKHEEGALLYNAAKTAKKGIVEIGSYAGKSTIYLAQGSMDGNKVPVYCIDTWLDCEQNPDIDTFPLFKQYTEKYKETITTIKGRSEQVVDSFNKEFDVLFIDGGHEYNQVMLDWNKWAKQIKKGVVFLHDIECCAGPKKLFYSLESLGYLTEAYGNIGRVLIGV